MVQMTYEDIDNAHHDENRAERAFPGEGAPERAPDTRTARSLKPKLFIFHPKMFFFKIS